MYYVYLLYSKIYNESYVGSTKDLKKRLKEHNDGKEISTRRYKPWGLVYYEAFTAEKLARMREKKLKYNGNAIKELKKRAGLPSTTFTDSSCVATEKNSVNTAYEKPRGLGNKSGAGFTMVELMVSVSIFVIITTIILASYPKFSSRIILENVVHQTALSIRQAQTFGLSVRTFGTGLDVFPTYGVHFSFTGITESDPSDNRNFLIFADILPGFGTENMGNGLYDGVSSCNVTGGECIEQFTIQSLDRITHLCGNLKAFGGTVEEPNGADCSLTSLDISFSRPDPEANISGYSVSEGQAVSFSDAEIVIESPREDRKTIVVWSTGQISVE